MRSDLDTLTGETVELLQQMIRNQCVNDGRPDAAQEISTAALLRDEIEGLGLDVEMWEVEPGRTSLITRYEGTDSDAPSICLMGHTDVVPVNAEGWRHDPFGGDVITSPDGVEEVWGRGAVDMLNLTSSMFVAFRDIVRTGARYPGDIIYFAVADEEMGGALGAKPIVADHWDMVQCDYVLTEYGGTPSTGVDGTTVLLTTGEKNSAGRIITVHGTPGHGSMPWSADNALIKAAKIVTRLEASGVAPRIDDMFRARVAALGLSDDLSRRLTDPAFIDDALAELPIDLARNLHSCCHMSFSPNVLRAGEKSNTVADKAVLTVDIRMLPGDTQADCNRILTEIIGPDLMPSVDIEDALEDLVDGTPFSTTDTPLWDALSDSIQMAYPGATVIPSLVTGATDGRFFRRRGVPVYGAGLLSDKVTLTEFLSRFHGHNERIDVDSLRLTTQLWFDVLDRLW